MRHIRNRGRVAYLQVGDIIDSFNQKHAKFGLPHRPLSLRMASMPNHHDLKALFAHFQDFDMNLGDQRASGIEYLEATALRLPAYGLRHAMRAEDQRRTRRNKCEILDEYRPLGSQVFDHILVVHNLVTHVDRCAVQFDGALNDADGALDARAKAARLRQQNL